MLLIICLILEKMAEKSTNSKPLPRSPKVAKIQEEVGKKSPMRSPFRDVLKQRCALRMRNSRDKLLNSLRGVQGVQQEIKDVLKDEAAAVRGGRRRILTLGISDQEAELIEVAGIFSETDLAVVCPLCKVYPLY
ncbi:uncharacterized protein LOC111716645 isoform X2 [Eurytemora carolleeae]|uniref:uncharacterized protein LOC111716645 isoform X2 n=1 Tax=Eurytemora carolleeae TaxID=1294199 RepID=UPI000C78FC3A|nr:uncharacterized protein LOC111716645 isoform X2 [Eurytemora carolleeae]|eukprot:XP_023347892.1 uncharacterized protein LOC111716645 isoform X2 [Eurytemora affinis]